MRAKGDSTFVEIPVSVLAAAMANYPNTKVKVSKGWVKNIEAALSDVRFGVSGNGATEASAVDAEAKAVATVD